jgi:hypothetical protein
MLVRSVDISLGQPVLVQVILEVLDSGDFETVSTQEFF